MKEEDQATFEKTKPGGRKSFLPSLSKVFQPLDKASFPHQPEVPHHSLPGTIENIAHMLMGYGITVSNDVITKSTTLSMAGLANTDGMQEALLATVISLANLNKLPSSNISGYIEALAKAHEANCAEEWMKSKPWDEVDRMDAITDTVTAAPGYPAFLKRTLIKKWLLSIAAAATRRSFSARGVLTFQGAQGIGKTSWFRRLIDDDGLRERLIKIDHHLDVHNKDSKLGAIKHLIVELGELDSTIKKDFARLKGFLTSDQDKIRKPYARLESEYQRRTVFCASVNEYNFLEDSTGNSRFWTIPAVSIDYQHDIDMQQLFAQLLVMLDKGAEWWLDKEEEGLLEEQNRKHRAVSVMRDLFLEHVDVERVDVGGCEAYTSSEVLKKLGIQYPTNGQAKECARTLREYFGGSRKIRDRDRWRVPFRAQPAYRSTAEDDDRFGDITF
ncbi:VapE domain-containing protein [Hydrogenophaga sp. PBL-H3]|uniref:VapE domain-containing protein n=1 Tax=Hydrogenophaga sp. PBL-H3 TaxID=434010 RepID=UPI0013588537|nr:VapE domain-containing protein [Hydrogenophaga sp. PBL-H3]